MGQKRKKHSDEFEAQVALEAVRGVRTLSELSSAHTVHPAVIAHWKRQLADGAATVFTLAVGNGLRTEEEITAPLYEESGRLKMEVDSLKKALNRPRTEKRIWIGPEHTELSVTWQCAVVGLPRSSYYCEPMGTESVEDLRLMRRIDELYLKRPFFGSPRMTD